MKGTLTIYGVVVNWEAAEDQDDGFDWRVLQCSSTPEYQLTCEDIAETMDDYYDDIEAEVRKAYYAGLAEERAEAQLYAAGY